MPTIEIRLRDGQETSFEAAAGRSLMEALRDAAIGDVAALCGGCCSCATCHVYVLERGDLLPPLGPDEDAMLEGSLYRREGSRLSCQLPVEASWTGLKFAIAPEE
jgi:2Fe-2S ferredoxin